MEAAEDGHNNPTNNFELIKFQVKVELDTAEILNIICYEFSNQFMLFVTESSVIGSMIEAMPDDPVDLGNPTTYSVTTVFGKEDLSLHLLARRLVEVLQKRLLLATSSHSLKNECIRAIEDQVSRCMKDSSRPHQA